METKIVEENGIRYTQSIDASGTVCWYKEGTDIPYRENGPAIEYGDGTKFWFKDGLIHRYNGPALEYSNGTKVWCKEGSYHREDGPAVEYADEKKEYWVNNERLKDIKTDEELIIKLLLE